jgi:hypothetical protein
MFVTDVVQAVPVLERELNSRRSHRLSWRGSHDFKIVISVKLVTYKRLYILIDLLRQGIYWQQEFTGAAERNHAERNH